MSSFRLTVPGNLLLAGEYAVLEEGGLGAALAVEPRLTVTVFPAERWEIVGRWIGGGELTGAGGRHARVPQAGRHFSQTIDSLQRQSYRATDGSVSRSSSSAEATASDRGGQNATRSTAAATNAIAIGTRKSCR